MHDIFETFPFLFDTVNNPLNSARTEAENHVLEKTGGGLFVINLLLYSAPLQYQSILVLRSYA